MLPYSPFQRVEQIVLATDLVMVRGPLQAPVRAERVCAEQHDVEHDARAPHIHHPPIIAVVAAQEHFRSCMQTSSTVDEL
jgi:hypothetical protein